MVMSMDALFGLPRKKSTGISYRGAIHGHYFFNDQSMVDEFVSSIPTRKKRMERLLHTGYWYPPIKSMYFRCAVNFLLVML